LKAAQSLRCLKAALAPGVHIETGIKLVVGISPKAGHPLAQNLPQLLALGAALDVQIVLFVEGDLPAAAAIVPAVPRQAVKVLIAQGHQGCADRNSLLVHNGSPFSS
jgi:hypothetical protein